MKRTWLWSLVAVMSLVSSSAFAITIDGDRSDWDASGLLKSDPIGDHLRLNSAVADITQWAVTAQTDPSDGKRYLYVFIEDPSVSSFMSSGHLFGAAYCDVDRVGGFTSWGPLPGGKEGWNGPSTLGARTSYAWNEFSYPVAPYTTGSGNFDGMDAAVEWGPNDEGFNFWGSATYDNLYQQGNAVVGGSTASGSNFIEYRVPISQIKAEVESYPDHVANPEMAESKAIWKVAVRFAGQLGSSNYDGDKSGNADNPADANSPVWVYVAADTLDGDANEDRVVNFSDYLVLSTNYLQTGKTVFEGDFTGDGAVNFSDYLVLSSNYGGTYGGSNAVPEPATMGLMILGGLALLRRKLA